MKRQVVYNTADKSNSLASSPAPQPTRSSSNSFLKSWAWKREHRSDRDRFELPYKHKLDVGGKEHILTIKQQPFQTTGFASTVWDSAIVLSKYIERWPALVTEKRCLELGAGCGLPGIVAASLGAEEVVLTDLPDNLPLLRVNAAANEVSDVVSVKDLIWGSPPSHLKPSYDVAIATDIMYIIDALDPLIQTMKSLSGTQTIILLAYGRNRQAEEVFQTRILPHFVMEKVANSALDVLYQCIDVDVYHLRLTVA